MNSTINSHFEQVSFLAQRDDYRLTGRLYTPDQAPHTTLLINSGTGIPQGFYSRFAQYAVARGFAVLTFDYRGIGDSAPKDLSKLNANYRDWGQRDVPAAIDWLAARFPETPLTVIGHSTGGQQLGLASNLNKVSAATFVSVSTGYWKGTLPNKKWLSLLLWKLYIPLTTKLLGYGAAKKIGFGENLPSGVALEWGSWCMEPNYLAAFFDETGHRKSVNGKAFGPTHFEDASFPIHAYCFNDDDIATQANVPPLLALFKSAAVTTRWVAPTDIGQRAIGHFGFFRANIGEALWNEALDWLQSQAHASQVQLNKRSA